MERWAAITTLLTWQTWQSQQIMFVKSSPLVRWWSTSAPNESFHSWSYWPVLCTIIMIVPLFFRNTRRNAKLQQLGTSLLFTLLTILRVSWVCALAWCYNVFLCLNSIVEQFINTTVFWVYHYVIVTDCANYVECSMESTFYDWKLCFD